MKSATIGSVKTKAREGISSTRKKESFGNTPQKRDTRITQEGKDFLRTRSKTYMVLLM